MDEAELVAAARDGEREAFEELVRASFTDTYTLAFRLTGREEDALDVTQDAYLRAWKGMSKFRGDARFSTWMYRITANAAASHMSKRQRHKAEPLSEVEDPADQRAEAHPPTMLEQLESSHAMVAALDTLPPKQRVVVVLKDVYDLAHDEIAEELGISVSAAKVRLHRGRKKLRDALYDSEEQAHAV